MDTHEHHVPDEDLPLAGIIDPNFSRSMLKQGEESGVLLWNDESEKYEKSSRALMIEVAGEIMERAQRMDPRADQEEVMQAIIGCIPWIADCHFQQVSNDEFHEIESRGFVVNSNGEASLSPEDFEVEDTFPEDWAGGTTES
jgi:hypothetical protein